MEKENTVTKTKNIPLEHWNTINSPKPLSSRSAARPGAVPGSEVWSELRSERELTWPRVSPKRIRAGGGAIQEAWNSRIPATG